MGVSWEDLGWPVQRHTQVGRSEHLGTTESTVGWGLANWDGNYEGL